mmetsp:Transcript_14889/g.24257  ORF Transcript_14889/g.24257 Transcript_14889/m.24257 type:complete len:98 (-) Transcript_14889:149-442(-)
MGPPQLPLRQGLGRRGNHLVLSQRGVSWTGVGLGKAALPLLGLTAAGIMRGVMISNNMQYSAVQVFQNVFCPCFFFYVYCYGMFVLKSMLFGQLNDD